MAETNGAAPTTTALATSGSQGHEPAASSGKTALVDALRSHFSGDAPLTEKARNFARARPWTSAAFVGVAALAVLNSLRGRSAR